MNVNPDKNVARALKSVAVRRKSSAVLGRQSATSSNSALDIAPPFFIATCILLIRQLIYRDYLLTTRSYRLFLYTIQIHQSNPSQPESDTVRPDGGNQIMKFQ